MRIRRAVRGDLAAFRDIQWVSGQGFREYGLDDVADNEPASLEALADYADDGRAWVAVDQQGHPIGFVLVDTVDGGGYIEQVSVAPEHQGRGVGRGLIEEVEGWAVSNGLCALTLTTFTHIPWNRPLYEHLGFRVLTDGEISPRVQALRDEEAHRGLDPELRVVMRLDLQTRDSDRTRSP